MRFEGTAYRAHDPRWAFQPLSGDGAAVRGGRFNPKGMPALYLGLTIVTAVKEANQGFARKLDPCVLCAYEIACENVVDLRTDSARHTAEVAFEDLACPWLAMVTARQEPPSWRLAYRLFDIGQAGILVPSFAPGATPDDTNLVLWRWGSEPPHQVNVFDPSGRLPKDQLSWR